MGVVYKAEDTKLNRTVALKFRAPHLISNSEVRRRFIQEAKTAAAAQHPNICNVFEIGVADGGEMAQAAEAAETGLKIAPGEGLLQVALGMAYALGGHRD